MVAVAVKERSESRIAISGNTSKIASKKKLRFSRFSGNPVTRYCSLHQNMELLRISSMIYSFSPFMSSGGGGGGACLPGIRLTRASVNLTTLNTG